MESLQSDKRGAHFCSSLLVNAVLAYGCVGWRIARYDEADSGNSIVSGGCRTASDIETLIVLATDLLRRLEALGRLFAERQTNPSYNNLRGNDH